ncbi:MAG: DUF3284 domain-containing protein [Anaerorhabdus sp.]
MKLKRLLKITEQEFYDHIEKEFIQNFKDCTGTEIEISDFKKGLSYVQTSKKNPAGTTYTVTNYTRGVSYAVEARSIADTFSLFYETNPVEKGLEVTLHQTVASFNKSAHNKLMGALSEGIYLGRMSDVLYGIQNKIIDSRIKAK